jgi:hypothetical protein
MDNARCPGCGALVPQSDVPTHTYMHSAAGCWERYCSLEEWKAGLTGEQAIVTVQDLVDCYAVQHPTNRDRRNRQSVAVHLMSLCAGQERGLSGRQRRSRIGGWVGPEYPALDPHPVRYPITVDDVAEAGSGRTRMIERMAALTWSLWSAHHDTVRGWLDR